MDQPHRKTIKHEENAAHVRELTFSCYRRMPLLTNNEWRAMLSESINRALQGHGFRLTAFVYMPEHVHLLVYPLPGADGVSALLKAIKRPFASRIKELLLAAKSRLIEKLTIRQRPGVTTFRYWQEGPGYDRNLENPPAVVRSIDYIHTNPVKRGLCQKPTDWRWSSAAFYCGDSCQQDPLLPKIDKLPAEFLQ